MYDLTDAEIACDNSDFIKECVTLIATRCRDDEESKQRLIRKIKEVSQLEKIAERRYHVDFNQGLDARLVTEDIARMQAKVKWIKRIRFGCDTPAQIAECERAIQLVRQAGYKGEFFLYCILIDFAESYHRLNYWRKYKYVLPHAQPYRDLNNPHKRIPQWQKDMAHWADRKVLYRSCDFKDFRPRKGFICKQYFKS